MPNTPPPPVAARPEIDVDALPKYCHKLVVIASAAVQHRHFWGAKRVGDLLLEPMDPKEDFLRYKFRVSAHSRTDIEITPQMALDTLLNSGKLVTQVKPPTIDDITVFSERCVFLIEGVPKPEKVGEERVDLGGIVPGWTWVPGI